MPLKGITQRRIRRRASRLKLSLKQSAPVVVFGPLTVRAGVPSAAIIRASSATWRWIGGICSGLLPGGNAPNATFSDSIRSLAYPLGDGSPIRRALRPATINQLVKGQFMRRSWNVDDQTWEEVLEAGDLAGLIADWQYEVQNGDTVLGFDEWVQHWKMARQGGAL